MVSVSIAKKTRNAVLRSKKRVWTIDDFKMDKPGAILRELSRLTEEGLLVRVSKGIYVRPVSTPLGPSTLSKEEIAKIKAIRKGADIIPTGYTGFNTLGITTQMSGVMELAVDRPVRISGIDKSRVRFFVRDRRTLMNKAEHTILEALRRINHISDASPTEVIDAVKKNITSDKVSIEKLALLALRSEPPRVRALVGAIGEEMNAKKDILNRLHDSLNPTTIFRIPVGPILPYASNWRIRD